MTDFGLRLLISARRVNVIYFFFVTNVLMLSLSWRWAPCFDPAFRPLAWEEGGVVPKVGRYGAKRAGFRR